MSIEEMCSSLLKLTKEEAVVNNRSNLKKKLVLKHFPNLKELKKKAVETENLIPKLLKESEKLDEILIALEGVTLHNDFPVKVVSLSNGQEVTSGCDEVTRSAYVKPGEATNKFVVTLYQNETHISTDEGINIVGEYKKAEALTIAKDWVATSKRDAETPSKVRSKNKKD